MEAYWTACWILKEKHLLALCVTVRHAVCFRACIGGGVARPGPDHQSANFVSRSVPFNRLCTAKTRFLPSCKESCFNVTKATYPERNSMRQLPALWVFFFSWRNVKVDRTDFWPSEDFIYIRLECQIRCARAPVLLFGALWIGYGMSLRQDQGGNEKEYEFQASMSVLCLFIFRSCHHQAAEEMNKGTDDKNQGKTCPSKNIHMLSEDKYHEMLHVVTKLACVHCLSWQPPSNNKRSTCISF